VVGIVCEAHDIRLARDIAQKVLPEDPASHPLRWETRALAAIDHPNIRRVYFVEEDHGAHFLTMASGSSRSWR